MGDCPEAEKCFTAVGTMVLQGLAVRWRFCPAHAAYEMQDYRDACQGRSTFPEYKKERPSLESVSKFGKMHFRRLELHFCVGFP